MIILQTWLYCFVIGHIRGFTGLSFCFSACQEKENQERNKDPGESEGWPKYHLTLRYCQGSRGTFGLHVVV